MYREGGTAQHGFDLPIHRETTTPLPDFGHEKSLSLHYDLLNYLYTSNHQYCDGEGNIQEGASENLTEGVAA
jgi:hypothetical protein